MQRRHLLSPTQIVTMISVAAAVQACSDVNAPRRLSPIASMTAVAAPVNSSRSGWSDSSDDAIWRQMAKDSVLLVGVKPPGATRAVIRGRPQASRTEWTRYLNGLNNESGVRLIWADTLLPFGALKVRDIAVLTRIRRLPFIAYAEPAYQPIEPMIDECGSGTSGPGNGSFSGTLMPVNGPFGTDYVSQSFSSMKITDAWYYGAGAGITLGDVGTGLDTDVNSEFGPSYFASGESIGRTVTRLSQSGQPSCSHDTRIAGVATAPKNGRGVVGIAYRSSLVTAYTGSSYFPLDQTAFFGVRSVADAGARVIEMAFRTGNASSFLGDEIDYEYYNRDVMFVGAAGTCAPELGDKCTDMSSAVYPAAKGEVLAVTASSTDGSRPTGTFNYGSKGGVMAYIDQPTTGLGTQAQIIGVGGTSAASAVVAGVATLVRSRYPGLTNRQVMDRLLNTRGDRCTEPPPQWMNDMINALAAVGGLCVPRPYGPTAVTVTYAQPSTTATFCVYPSQGSGAYSYQWVNGSFSTSACATYTFWLAQDFNNYYHYVAVNVRDLTTGHIVTNSLNVFVWYQRNDGDPCPEGQICTY